MVKASTQKAVPQQSPKAVAAKSVKTTKKGTGKPGPLAVAGMTIGVLLAIALVIGALIFAMNAREKSNRLERLGSLFESAANTALEAKKPADFDFSIAEFESLKEQAAGTVFEAKAGEQIEKLKDAKEAALKEAKTKIPPKSK